MPLYTSLLGEKEIDKKKKKKKLDDVAVCDIDRTVHSVHTLFMATPNIRRVCGVKVPLTAVFACAE